MNDLRYTAKIRFEQDVVKTIPGDDLDKLVAKLINLLETDYNYAIGEIVDNQTGKIIQQCQKRTSE